jgi:hypothetical protein
MFDIEHSDTHTIGVGLLNQLSELLLKGRTRSLEQVQKHAAAAYGKRHH